MPWCEGCKRFYNPPSLTAEGECRACGRALGEPEEAPPVPWHFKLLVVGIVLYLAFRAYQGIVWILQRL